MIKKKIILTLFIALQFIPCMIIAQDTLQHAPNGWSLEDCIAYAKKNNIQIRSLQWNEVSGKEDLLQAKASRLPLLTGSVSENVLNGKSSNATGEFERNANVSGNYSLNSSITLYNGGYIKSDIAEKNLLLHAARLDVLEAQNDITLNVTQAYLSILLAQENIVYINDVLANSEVQLKLGKQRFDAGAVARKELVQLEAQVASDRYTLITAQNDFRLNLVNLKQLLQLPSAYDFKIIVPDTVIVEKMATTLPEAQEAAQETRPEVKNDEIGIQIAQAGLDKARATAKPTISLGGTIATGTSSNQDPKYFTQFNNNFYQSLGVSMSVPIFTRRINKTAVEKSKVFIEQAKLSLLNTKTVLDQQVEQAYINLQSADAQYDAASVQVKASEESYSITNEQFRLGSINLLELQQERVLYIQALQSFIQAKYNAVLNYKIVDFYAGKPITL